MAMTPEPLLPVTHAVSFRAPPPSPVAQGRPPTISNDDVLTEYLEQSLRVPDLILPDRVFPKQKSVRTPPKIDLNSIDSLEKESRERICILIAQAGCLEVINHGISRDLIKFVLLLAGGIFEISPEKKNTMTRSSERRYGFEEVHGEDEIRDQSEEFLWCGDEGMRLEMEGVWPFGYSNFSQEMEKLYGEIEGLGTKTLQFLEQHMMMGKLCSQNISPEDEEPAENFCHIQKHGRSTTSDSPENSLSYDVIRMLIRGSEYPHALCLHICNGSTDFHVYSKKGWISFCPNQDSIVITIGDKLQASSDGRCKHVTGRPVFKDEDEKCIISMGFLFSPSNRIKKDRTLTISLNQQIVFAVLITLIFQLLSVYVLPFVV